MGVLAVRGCCHCHLSWFGFDVSSLSHGHASTSESLGVVETSIIGVSRAFIIFSQKTPSTYVSLSHGLLSPTGVVVQDLGLSP